jgi:hypothetical protein
LDLVELNLSAIGSEFYSRTEGDRKHAVNDVATMASRTASVATIRAVGSRQRPGDLGRDLRNKPSFCLHHAASGANQNR